MKKILLAIFCCSLSILASAQTSTPTPIPTITVKGSVIDSASKQPIGYVTVALEDAKSKTTVRSNLTKVDGTFQIKGPAGNYIVALVSVGYKDKVLPLIGNGTAIDMGKIVMQASSNKLGEVSI